MELYLPPLKAIEREKHDPVNGRFRKGIKPWNKGLRGLNIGGKESQYKKGHLPHNTKKDGDISIREHKRDNASYKYIRIAKAKWVLLHRHIWEKGNGPIEKWTVIRFIDGDTLNCSIDNLECISRAEHIKRNRNDKKRVESLKQRWETEKLRAKYGLETETKWFTKSKI